MAKEFDFEKEKINLMRKGFDYKEISGKNYKDFNFKKKGFLGDAIKYFRIMEGSPTVDDLKKFVNDAKNLNDKEDLGNDDQIILVTPSYDNKLLKAFIEQTGILNRGKLSTVIKVKIAPSKISHIVKEEVKEVAKIEARKEVKKVMKESKKMETFDEVVKATSSLVISKELRQAKESAVESVLFNVLYNKFGDKVKYQKEVSSGKIDIVVDKKIGVEIKMVKGRSDIDRLYGQVDRYLKDYKYLVLLMIDVKQKPDVEFKEVEKDLEKKGELVGGYVEVIIK